MAALKETVDTVESIDVDAYKYGFSTDIESDKAPKGLYEDIVRFISAKKNEPEWLTEWRLEAYRRWLTMTEPNWARVEHPPIDYQDLYYYSAPKSTPGPTSLDEVDPELLRTYEKLGIPLREQEILAGVADAQGRGRRGVRQRLGRDDLQGGAGQGRRHLLPDLGGRARASRTRAQISRLGRAGDRQFLRDAELGGVFRRLLRLCAAGRALPDGAVDLFPHQREEHRPVRAHADHRRRGLLCQLSRRLHGAQARREPAARGGRRAGRARRRRDQIFDRAELVSRRQRGQGRHLQFRDQARRLPRPQFAHLLDAGRDRLGDHLEISVLHPARRQFAGRVLFDRHVERPPAGRQRHQDDPSRQEHEEPHHLQGHFGGPLAEHLSRPRLGASQGRRRAQFHQLRLPADRRPLRRAYRALYREQESERAVRARGDDLENLARTSCSTRCSAGFRRRRRRR